MDVNSDIGYIEWLGWKYDKRKTNKVCKLGILLDISLYIYIFKNVTTLKHIIKAAPK